MPISMNNTTLTFNNGTTMTTAATGTVTSVATGNGLSGGTITTSGTLAIAAPNFNTVGSYCFVRRESSNFSISSGTNFSAGSGLSQATSCYVAYDLTSAGTQNNLSGTWKWLGSESGTSSSVAIAVRVS